MPCDRQFGEDDEVAAGPRRFFDEAQVGGTIVVKILGVAMDLRRSGGDGVQ